MNRRSMTLSTTTLLGFAWLIPATAMLAASTVEGMAYRNHWDFARVIGLAACLVWPLTVAIILGAGLLGRSRPPRLARHGDFID